MFAGKDVAGSAHIRGQLVDLVHSVHDCPDQLGIPQVADNEFVRGRFGVLMPLQVYAANPEALTLQPLDQVASNESASAIHQNSFLHGSLPFSNVALLGGSDGLARNRVLRGRARGALLNPQPLQLPKRFPHGGAAESRAGRAVVDGHLANPQIAAVDLDLGLKEVCA